MKHAHATPAQPAERPANHAAPHILIIGGGASGVLMALHLLRQPTAPRVTVIEPRGALGAGIAYATTDPEHLLNTRVHNMAAFPDDPQHFHRWLQQRAGDAAISDQGFVSRATYGAYLGGLLDPWRQDARLTLRVAEVVDLADTDTGVVARLADGQSVTASRAVLATGHVTPDQSRQWPMAAAWDRVPPSDPDGRVIIIGSGLSMVDQVLSLLRGGHRGPILSLSRRGLLPRDHAATRPLSVDLADLPLGQPVSCLLQWARGLARQAVAQNGSWRDAVDAIRPHVRRLWQALPGAERARFLRHAATWWDVHRHRIPPQSRATLDHAILDGQLTIRRAAFRGAMALPDGGFAAHLRPFGSTGTEGVTAVRIVDCRGIRRDPELHASPLVASLLTKGTARIDAQRIGLDVDDQGRLIRANGSSTARIHVIGPAARAAFWEITAIPDIRTQVAELAYNLAKTKA